MSRTFWRVSRAQSAQSLTVLDEKPARELAAFLSLRTGTHWQAEALPTPAARAGGDRRRPLPHFIATVNEALRVTLADRESARVLNELLSGHAEEDAKPTQPPSLFRTEKSGERRRFERFPVELKLILVSGGKTYRVFSKNLSVGGALLSSDVPAHLIQQSCKVYVNRQSYGMENLELEGRLVEDAKGRARLNFADSSPALLKKLEDWIHEEVRAEAKRPRKKKAA